MKFIIALCAFLALSAAQTYAPTNDHLDIEALIRDDNEFKAFFACFLDQGDCNEVAADFKHDLPEAFQEACAKCTQAQKHILKRFLEAGTLIHPSETQALIKKYDPENKYYTELQKAIENA